MEIAGSGLDKLLITDNHFDGFPGNFVWEEVTGLDYNYDEVKSLVIFIIGSGEQEKIAHTCCETNSMILTRFYIPNQKIQNNKYLLLI